MALTPDDLFAQIESLVMCHSPSGAECEINQFLIEAFDALGVEHWRDDADNIIAKIPGRDEVEAAAQNRPSRAIAITAHKDEIGAIVKTVHEDGKISVRRLGGAFPWVYGEGVVDLLGDQKTVSGILCFGSRHVSHESPQKSLQEGQSVAWENAWIETCQTADELTQAGVRPGTRMVVGKHRKRPFRMGDTIASYTLDNKASVAILLALAERLKQPSQQPPVTVYLVASAKEEVGALGALYFTQRHSLEALVALEICPFSEEYPIEAGPVPVLLSQDGYGVYDEGLNWQIRQAAAALETPL
ncbi:MAG TPA: M20/M25/M40 family metallo-hydrolase, partial [Trichocoleus sp.]